MAVQYHNGRLVHFFPCGAHKCKLSVGGVRRFQDSKDKSSTTNLRHHANCCWGKEAVDRAFNGGKVQATSGSVFSAFARKGQQPVRHTYRMHTSNEVRANFVRWITENNRPVNIINDRALRDLSTRAFLCLGSWLRCDLLAPEDLINVMKSLKKRKREDESVM